MTEYTATEMRAIVAALTSCEANGEEFACALDPSRAAEACGMFADREARCGWDREVFAAAYAAIALRSPLHAFLKRFPQVSRDESTGGGCTAWILKAKCGGYLMFTSPEGAHQPDESDEFVAVGYYDAHGEWDEVNRPDYSWAELTAFVDGFLTGRKPAWRV